VLYGIGNPLVDTIVRVQTDALERLGVVAGSMNLVDYEHQKKALGAGSTVRQLPGGSCANTVRGVKWLLGATGSALEVAYTGAVGRDRSGDGFEALLDTEGVVPVLARKATPTGSSVVLVTPDSQRTMFTYLGACRDLASADIDTQRVRSCKILHTTGYMWDTPNQEEAAREAVREARSANRLVSFDVADPFVVDRYHDSLSKWIPGNVDILFANAAELSALVAFRGEDEEILRRAKTFAPTVVMKTGRRGCMVYSAGKVTRCDALGDSRSDTTGAGDAFAAGFLFGLLHNNNVESCARTANAIAGQIVTVDGCNYDALDPARVRSMILT
jgi:sugar/nucleoside kinase (ribokinase family)